MHKVDIIYDYKLLLKNLANKSLQHEKSIVGDEDMPMVTQVTHKQVHERPITRSPAKKLQQEMNTLLCEIYFNINDNYILPKLCTLLLLKFTKEDDKIQKEKTTKKDHPRARPVLQNILKEAVITFDSQKI